MTLQKHDIIAEFSLHNKCTWQHHTSSGAAADNVK